MEGRLSGRTFKNYYSFLHRFLRATGYGPDEVLVWARGCASEGYVPVLDAIQKFVTARRELRHKSQQFTNAAIRSFFLHNRINLPSDPTLRILSDTAPVERQLSMESLHELIGLAPQPWRSMILVVASTPR